MVVNEERIKVSWFGKSRLSLYGKGITDISEIKGLETLTSLEVLWLQNNQITEIKGLETLTNLEELWLHNNQISEIKGLETLTNLKELYLENNQISEIKGLETLTNLKNLDLANNQISEIKGLETLTNLKSLNLAYNQISEIKGLDTLTNLDDLMLDFNKDGLMRKLYSIYLEDREVDALIELGALIAELPYRGGIKLVKFDKSSNCDDFDHYITIWYENQHVIGIAFSGLEDRFKNILDGIGNFSHLRILILFETETHPFPSNFKNLRNLEELEFIYFQEDDGSVDQVFVFPKLEFSEVFNNFINLKRIKINGQFNVYFPPSFTSIPNLKELHLSYCTCTSDLSTYLKNSEIDPNDLESWETLSCSDLPEDLGKLTSLQKLYLEEVYIKNIPTSIANVPQLKEFELHYSFSTWLKKMLKNVDPVYSITSLEKLVLYRCRLESISNKIGNLTNLKELNLYLNRIKTIPPELINCQKLVKIDLSRNPLEEELNFLEELQNLQYIRISQSQSHLIPKELYNKINLEIEVANL